MHLNTLPIKKRGVLPVSKKPPGSRVNYLWFKQILADRQMSQRQLAKRMLLDPSAVNLMLRGKRKINVEEAAQLAKIIGEPLDEVVAALGIDPGMPKKGVRKVPVTGWVDAEFVVHKGRVEGLRSVEAPPLSIEGLEALRCQTSMSSAENFDGWVMYFRPRVGVEADTIGKLCVVMTDGGAYLLRVVRQGYRRGTYNLVALVGGEVTEDVRLMSASPVVWTQQ